MRTWCVLGRRKILAVFLVSFELISAALHAEDSPWLEGISRARPTLDPYGNEAFEMTNTRYGRFEIYLQNRLGVSPAIFEEVTTRSEVGGPAVVAHTRLRVWRYDQRKPKLGDPLYTIDVDCDEGRFISDSFVPEFYELTCGAGFDYRYRRLYRVSDGRFVGEADYDSASLGLLVMDYPIPHYDHPPYPFALLTFMSRDAVIDRVVVAHDDLDYAAGLASVSDSSHKLSFGSTLRPAMLFEMVSEDELPSVRLVYSIRSDRSQQLLIPVTEERLKIEETALPKGFSLIRVPLNGDLGHGFVTPKLRDPG